jgi:GNAT superfamily N-acetyltransferase
VVRQAHRSDIPGMHRVRLAVTENTLAPGAISEVDYIPAIEVTGRGWVIESAGEVIGFAIANADTGNIWAFFVDPRHHGNGVGRQLHDAMIAWLWSRGLETLWLSTEPATRAERFYRAAGWQPAGATARGELRFERYRSKPLDDCAG